MQLLPPSPWIGLDGRGLTLDRGTGVSSYSHELAEAVRRLDYPIELLRSGSGLPRWWRWLAALPPGARATEVVPGEAGFGRIRRADDIFRIAQVHFDIRGRPLTLRGASPPAVMHWTYPLPLILRGALNIYTIHDVIPQTAPELTSISQIRNRRMLASLLAVADHVVTVSESSRQAIIDAFGYPPEKVTNTYQSVASDTGPSLSLEDAGLTGLTPRGFYLSVGTVEARKNVGRLIQAYLASGAECPLVIAGPDGWRAEAELAPAHGHRIGIDKVAGEGPGILRLGYLPRPAIRALFENARALLFPSFAEGFGLPIVEAMAVGTPVLTARGGATGEVAADAALLVDPLNIADMAVGIAAIETDPALRGMYAERGLHRATDFSAERYADRLGALYRQLLARI